jgi:hypothetical protein
MISRARELLARLAEATISPMETLTQLSQSHRHQWWKCWLVCQASDLNQELGSLHYRQALYIQAIEGLGKWDFSAAIAVLDIVLDERGVEMGKLRGYSLKEVEEVRDGLINLQSQPHLWVV